jgi:hypothetical protein
MMPRDDWEQADAERQLALIRERRQALEAFAVGLPAVLAAAPGAERRAQIAPLAERLAQHLRQFHLSDLDEMERLRREIEALGSA